MPRSAKAGRKQFWIAPDGAPAVRCQQRRSAGGSAHRNGARLMCLGSRAPRGSVRSAIRPYEDETMIRTFTIKNYKSIQAATIELGRINIFIGENGAGKTNVLEAVAMASAALTDKLTFEELYSRGLRLAKPALTCSAFKGIPKQKNIEFACIYDKPSSRKSDTDSLATVEMSLTATGNSPLDTKWVDEKHVRKITFSSRGDQPALEAAFAKLVTALNAKERKSPRSAGQPVSSDTTANIKELAEVLVKLIGPEEARRFGTAMTTAGDRVFLQGLLSDFGIYNPSTLELRGLNVASRRTPLGLFGENLDLMVDSLSQAERAALVEKAHCMAWVDDIIIDSDKALDAKGFNLGQSTSKLYFRDGYMRPSVNHFSSENANEGILHIIFYHLLFTSPRTPAVFGIDNIETALNPQLLRTLISDIATQAKAHNKQALITTHNPAALDGLNLHDPDQRLFVVSRSHDGRTNIKRLTAKPSAEGKHGQKLSELWMRGLIGAIPRGF